MRRHTLIASTGAVAAGCLAAAVLADIVNTSHDFSALAWAGGEICKPCHTPHFADPAVGFLWAHRLSSLSYTLYDGTTTDPGGANALDQYSRMCLSCHDGSVALNDYHDSGGPPVFIDEPWRIGEGGNLLDDHPIGVAAEYPIAGSSDFNAPTLFPDGLYGFGGGDSPEVPLYPFSAEQVVSCSSCHSSHGETGIDSLLRKDNAASALCLTCHIK
jgi:predicted CXXCH cytochrome family protein